MKLSDAYKRIVASLGSVYPGQEASNIAFILLEHICGCKRSDIFVQGKLCLSEEEVIILERYLELMKNHFPVQYLTGRTCFLDCRIQVNPSVLIPRPETEELVKLCLERNKTDHPLILDIGTGSGCIAIALKKYLPGSQITAIDKSADAIQIAIDNADLNHTEVRFLKLDFLCADYHELGSESFHIIISNPPYVRESEKLQMRNNVLLYEPPEALFVPDSDPLIFYRAIADFAVNHLTAHGTVFLEINEYLAVQISILFQGKGFRNIEVLNDLSGKQRFLIASH